MGAFPVILRAALLFLALLPAKAALAGVTDCSGAGFRQIVELKDSTPFDCHVITSEVLSTPSGEAIVRAVRHKGLPAAPHDDQGVGAVLTAVAGYQAWAAHADAMGLRFPHVTILIADVDQGAGAFDSTNFGQSSVDVLPEGVPGECFLRVDTGAMADLSLEGAEVGLLVKLFRCIQGASYKKHMADIPPEVRAWWVRGQSLFMAGLVRPTPLAWDQAGSAFAAIRTTPLHKMNYGATPFFAFVWAEGGAALTGALMLSLEEAVFEDGQIDAIKDGIGTESLDRFVTQAVDGTISTPDGYSFAPLSPGDPQLFEDSGVLTLPTVPGTIDAAALHITQGNYYLVTGVTLKARQEGGGGWEDLPEEIRPSFCEDVVKLVVARFVDDSYAPSGGYDLDVMKFEPCFECTTLPERAKCLAGTWKLRDKDHLQWLEARTKGHEVEWDFANGSVHLEISADGKARWVLNGFEVGATIKTQPVQEGGDDLLTYINVTAEGEDQGVWSTSGQTLHYCETNAATAMDIEVRNGYYETQLAEVGYAESMEADFDCNAQHLIIIYTGPQTYGDFAPEWYFDRVK
jgi:hypothetical protein